MPRLSKTIALLIPFLLALLISCTNGTPRNGFPSGDTGTIAENTYRGYVDVILPPEKPTVGQWFTVDVGLAEYKGASAGNGPRPAPTVTPTPSPESNAVQITTDDGDRVNYKPANFALAPGKRKLVKIKINNNGSGIVPIAFYADEKYLPSTTELEVGFQGHLKLPNTVPLAYEEPAAVSVAIVDVNEKSLSVDAPLEMRVQAVDSLLSYGALTSTNGESKWTNDLKLEIKPGARSSPQFQIKSTNIKGGDVHFLATLNLQGNGTVVAQENFSLPVTPALWLPIFLAILGSLLFAAYNFVQSPKTGLRDIVLTIATAILGGFIAYLFAGFDLLGIKLDPNVLKTYPLLGFLFSYMGIEVLLAKRFRSANANRKNANKGIANKAFKRGASGNS